MDLNEMRNLFNNQKVTTNLTPQAVVEYAESRRKGRLRAVAVVAVVALTAGAGAGAMYYAHLSRQSQPHILATTSPSLSPESSPATDGPTESQQPNDPSPSGSAQEISFPERRCTVEWPQSWTDTLKEIPTFQGDVQPIPGHPNDRLVTDYSQGRGFPRFLWVTGDGQKILVTDQMAIESARPQTNGNLVVYPGNEGKLHVWSYGTTDQSATVFDDLTLGNDSLDSFELDGNNLWMLHEAQGESVLSMVTLGSEGGAVEVTRGANLSLLGAFNGAAQTTKGDGKVTLYKPDGTTGSLPEALGNRYVTAKSGDVYAARATDYSGQDVVWREGWSKPFDIPANGSLVGDWIVSGEPGSYEFFNYRTGVTVRGPSAEFGALTPNEDADGKGYLSHSFGATPNTDEPGSSRLIPTASLPEVRC